MDAQTVFERQCGGDLHSGPSEFVRVGVRFGDRVIWLGSAYFPGNDGKIYREDIELARSIVLHCRADLTAGERELREGVACILGNLTADRRVNPDAKPWLDPYISQAKDLLTKSGADPDPMEGRGDPS